MRSKWSRKIAKYDADNAHAAAPPHVAGSETSEAAGAS